MPSLPIRLRMAQAGDLLITRMSPMGIVLESINRQPATLFIPSCSELEFTKCIRHAPSERVNISVQNFIRPFGRIPDRERLATFMRYPTGGALCFADALWVHLSDVVPGQEARVLSVGRE